MKIALITDGIYPYVLGGMQKHSYYLAKYFSRLGHQTTVFHCTNNANPNYSEHFEANELENLNFVEVEFPKSDGLPGHYIRSSRAYSKKLFKAFWTQCKKADFIYTKGFTGIHFFKMKHLLNCPIGVQLHGLEMFQPGGNLKQWLEKRLLKSPAIQCLMNADVVFTYGGKIRDIIADLNVPDTAVIKQHGAANDFWLQPIKNNKKFTNTFIFVGRYEHRKGHHLINEVIPRIQHDFKLIMIGDVPKAKQVDHPAVSYVGNKSAEEVFDLISKSTFLLTPSLAEGFPTIIVEAMAQGAIPIATNVGAIAEIVNENNGFLFESDSAMELQNTIEKALHLSVNKRKQLSIAARKQVENNFNWNFAATQLLDQINTFCDSWKRTNS